MPGYLTRIDPARDPIELARRCVHADNATALGAVAELRAVLDELEEVHVAHARASGASWSEVAAALGVTKQAAHRKHASRRQPTRAQPDSRSGARQRASGRLLITSEARRTMQLARREAERLRSPALVPVHLLLGILACDYVAPARALEQAGASLADGRAAASRLASAQANGEAVTPATRHILERSLNEAVERGDGYLGVEHILLALLADPDPDTRRVLEAQGVDVGTVRRELDAALADWAVPSAD